VGEKRERKRTARCLMEQNFHSVDKVLEQHSDWFGTTFRLVRSLVGGGVAMHIHQSLPASFPTRMHECMCRCHHTLESAHIANRCGNGIEAAEAKRCGKIRCHTVVGKNALDGASAFARVVTVPPLPVRDATGCPLSKCE